MNDLTKYVMQQNSSTGRLVRSKVKWAGHMVRMDADTLVKRMEEKGEKTSGCKKGERTAKIEGLREVGYEKIGEVERWRGAADKKVWKEKKKE